MVKFRNNDTIQTFKGGNYCGHSFYTSTDEG